MDSIKWSVLVGPIHSTLFKYTPLEQERGGALKPVIFMVVKFTLFKYTPHLDIVVKFTVLKDCLCFCYTWGHEIVVWLMKEYQVEKSWTIEYKLSTFDFYVNRAWVYPIKVFKDGDILTLLKLWQHWLSYYSNKTTTQPVSIMFNDVDYPSFAMIFTPSLFSDSRMCSHSKS